MEPETKFYEDPVVVLDYQSLYPSIIIAYNLCYSTCIGKATPLDGTGDVFMRVNLIFTVACIIINVLNFNLKAERT